MPTFRFAKTAKGHPYFAEVGLTIVERPNDGIDFSWVSEARYNREEYGVFLERGVCAALNDVRGACGGARITVESLVESPAITTGNAVYCASYACACISLGVDAGQITFFHADTNSDEIEWRVAVDLKSPE